MTEFFIPHLLDNPAAAEAEWQRYINATRAPLESRRVYRLVYEHDDGARYEVTVGQERKQFRRKTGPRGGRIPNADLERYGRRTGAVVSAIIDTGDLIYVWCAEPPCGVWANPSLVGRTSVTSIDYFVPASADAPDTESRGQA